MKAPGAGSLRRFIFEDGRFQYIARYTMRMIVDSNCLRSNQLRDFLADSRHRVVLSDFAAMEAYAGETLITIFRSMEILATRPSQVLVLKGTEAVCGLNLSGLNAAERLIDPKQTKKFPEYITDLLAAQAGAVAIQQEILSLGSVAKSNLERVLNDVANLSGHFGDIAKQYSSDEIKILRRDEPLTNSMLEKILSNTMILSAYQFRRHPKVDRIPRLMRLPSSFIFRYMLCCYMLFLWWLARGGAESAKLERMRNDVVDMNFVAYATYFDGLLSTDKKSLEIFERVQVVLKAFDRFLGL